MNAVENAKRIAGTAIVDKVFRYIKNGDSSKHFDDVVKLARILTSDEDALAAIDMLRQKMSLPGSPQKELVAKIMSANDYWLRHALANFFINSLVVGRQRTLSLEKKLGIDLPFFLLIDPTERCNLRCNGCWAGNFKSSDMPFEVFDRIIVEAKEMGIYFLTISGGEPTLYPGLLEAMRKHRDVAFHFYTNGTMLAKPEYAKEFAGCGNGMPCFSLEGFREKTDERRGAGAFDTVMKAMNNLRQLDNPFGISCTATKNNFREISSDEFIDFMVDKGVLLCWYFMYIPIGRNPDFSLMLSPQERKHMWERTNLLRSQKPIVVADFWNDGPITNGCLAGGRRYLHITADGFVEPCAFVHFGHKDDNIQNKPLLDVIKNSKLFSAMRARQKPAYEGNPMRPCWVVDRPWALREVVKETEAFAVEDGSQPLMDPNTAAKLDAYARAWEPIANGIWDSIQEFNKVNNYPLHENKGDKTGLH
ncbi:MAG: radical SAM protein [Caldisericia bacterium]|nr:radical SAM protein [Caldisericia bacterium]